ncbi:MAG: hypothetical protein GKR90_21375 [Pseudomonadales bacterium]|nr:hypothetical protein [Pseudomonadales bacterium]
MAAIVLTFIGSLFLGGGLWFVVGSRFRFSPDDEQNERLNFALFFVGTLPVSFVLVFFGLGDT